MDALLAADRVLHLSERITDPRKFVRLDDTLLRSIENYELFHGDLSDCDDDKAVHEAQAVIARWAKNFRCQALCSANCARRQCTSLTIRWGGWDPEPKTCRQSVGHHFASKLMVCPGKALQR